MKLYRYYKGKVRSIEVEEKKSYYLAHSIDIAFNYHTKINKIAMETYLIGLSEDEALKLAFDKNTQEILKLNEQVKKLSDKQEIIRNLMTNSVIRGL